MGWSYYGDGYKHTSTTLRSYVSVGLCLKNEDASARSPRHARKMGVSAKSKRIKRAAKKSESLAATTTTTTKKVTNGYHPSSTASLRQEVNEATIAKTPVAAAAAAVAAAGTNAPPPPPSSDGTLERLLTPSQLAEVRARIKAKQQESRETPKLFFTMDKLIARGVSAAEALADTLLHADDDVDDVDRPKAVFDDAAVFRPRGGDGGRSGRGGVLNGSSMGGGVSSRGGGRGDGGKTGRNSGSVAGASGGEGDDDRVDGTDDGGGNEVSPPSTTAPATVVEPFLFPFDVQELLLRGLLGNCYVPRWCVLLRFKFVSKVGR